MHTISSLPAASRATTLTYRTHSYPSNQTREGFWKTSGRSARPPKPYLIPNDADARYPKSNLSQESRCDRFAERLSIQYGATLRRPFRLRGAVLPTLHASSRGSDAVGHVEGYNFSARSDIPVQRIRSIRKRRAGLAAAVRRPGRRRHRQTACPGAG